MKLAGLAMGCNIVMYTEYRYLEFFVKLLAENEMFAAVVWSFSLSVRKKDIATAMRHKKEERIMRVALACEYRNLRLMHE